MNHINPPRTDDLLERHQFYAALSAELSTLNDKDLRHHESVHRVHQRLDEAHKAEEATREQLITTETRNRTLAAAIVVVWTVISGGLSWIFDKSSTKVEQFAIKFEQQDKLFNEQKREIEKVKELNELVLTLKRKVDALDSELKANQNNQNQKPNKVPKS